LVSAAGAGARLVGVSAYSNYPSRAKKLPVVSSAGRTDFERLLALHPDLVIAWGSGNPGPDVVKLRSLGIPVFVLEPRWLNDIPASLLRIGKLAATPQAAQTAADRFRNSLQALRNRYRHRTPVTVFFQISASPLMTLNGEHIVSHVLDLCGGKNVFADLPQLAEPVGLEAIYARDPQVILVSDAVGDPAAVVAQWRKRKGLQAAQHRRVFVVSPDTLVRATPRILEGANQVCRLLDQVRGEN
jgi:iron complex transport system substrate-binding protein